jgi:hypothetical protein
MLIGLYQFSDAHRCSLTCDNIKNNLRCLERYKLNSTNDAVVLSFGYFELSWTCCKSPNCSIKMCDGDLSGIKCYEVTDFLISIPNSTSNVSIQVHDGQLYGLNRCLNKGDCCGGSSSSCGANSAPKNYIKVY